MAQKVYTEGEAAQLIVDIIRPIYTLSEAVMSLEDTGPFQNVHKHRADVGAAAGRALRELAELDIAAFEADAFNLINLTEAILGALAACGERVHGGWYDETKQPTDESVAAVFTMLPDLLWRKVRDHATAAVSRAPEGGVSHA